MPNPVFVFAFVIATMYGLAFHVVLGGNARRMVLFIVTSWVGFLLGQYVGAYLDITFLRIGVIHLAPASVTAVGLLIFAHALTADPTTPVSRR
ncbi:MAG: hypothetical protein OXG23_00295 [Chloroflexi bacterium]|nr:hypothetical protein [Chloroflexota bacterium]MCY3976511.1 hypothetical protein [Chloroflexota bacterium]MDE2635798.1 hypothetical protein [Chloroflexota bacterium]MYE26203.1 hypothetical protein [Chloroflexota bacterium]